MKTIGSFFALCFLLIPFASSAREPAAAHPSSVPPAKVLAIGRFTARPTPEQLKILSLRWYVTGKIDQWFSPLDGDGVILLLNLASVDEARAMLEAGPAGQSQLLTFELIPVEPLIPLTRLLPQPAKPAR